MLIGQETAAGNCPCSARRDAANGADVTDWPALSRLFRGLALMPCKQRLVRGVAGGETGFRKS